MMTDTAMTAAQAYERYSTFLKDDRIIQSDWHRDDNGRSLACALGVLGDEVDSPSDCPAQIMPRWLAQMVPWMFDGQTFDDAKDWGLLFYAELKRLNGNVPFSVIHDWHANVVGPLAIEVSTNRGRKVETHIALQAMQAASLAGQKFTADEWRPILKAAFFDANAYAYAYAYANADAYAYAYANADADAYAYAYAYANADANADANANANAKKKTIKRLADGLIECLVRVQAE